MSFDEFCSRFIGVDYSIFDSPQQEMIGYSVNESGKKQREFPDLNYYKNIGGAILYSNDLSKMLSKIGSYLPKFKMEDKTTPMGVFSIDFEGNLSGLGWRVVNIDGRCIVTHSGAVPGFSATMAFDTKSRVGLMVTANMDGLLFPLAMEGLDLIRSIQGERGLDESLSAEIEGDYFWRDDFTVFKLVKKEGHIEVEGVCLPPIMQQLKICEKGETIKAVGGMANYEDVEIVREQGMIKYIRIGSLRLERLNF